MFTFVLVYYLPKFRKIVLTIIFKLIFYTLKL